LASLLPEIILLGAACGCAGRAAGGGEASLAGCLDLGLRRSVDVLLVCLLLGLCLALFLAAMFLLLALASLIGLLWRPFGPAAAIFGCVCFCLRVSVSIPVCVMEGADARDSIRRSLELTRGRAWRIFLALLPIWAAMLVTGRAGLALLGQVDGSGPGFRAAVTILAAVLAAPMVLGLAGLPAIHGRLRDLEAGRPLPD
jgi:hypothetical protein